MFLCSSNKEFVPSRKVAKLSLKFQRDQVSDVWEKKTFLNGVTITLGCDWGQRPRMRQESHISEVT